MYTANGDGNVGYRVYNIRPSVQDTSRLQYKPVRITHPVHKTRLSYNTDRYILLTQCTRLVSVTIQTGTYNIHHCVQDTPHLQYRPVQAVRITYPVYKTRLSYNTDQNVLLCSVPVKINVSQAKQAILSVCTFVAKEKNHVCVHTCVEFIEFN